MDGSRLLVVRKGSVPEKEQDTVKKFRGDGMTGRNGRTGDRTV